MKHRYDLCGLSTLGVFTLAAPSFFHGSYPKQLINNPIKYESITRLTLQCNDVFLRDESPTVATTRLERSIAKSFTTLLEMHSRSYDVRNGANVFNLPNHSKKDKAVCRLSLHLGSSESCKTLEQKFIFQIGTLNPNGTNERFSFH